MNWESRSLDVSVLRKDLVKRFSTERSRIPAKLQPLKSASIPAVCVCRSVEKTGKAHISRHQSASIPAGTLSFPESTLQTIRANLVAGGEIDVRQDEPAAHATLHELASAHNRVPEIAAFSAFSVFPSFFLFFVEKRMNEEKKKGQRESI